MSFGPKAVQLNRMEGAMNRVFTSIFILQLHTMELVPTELGCAPTEREIIYLFARATEL